MTLDKAIQLIDEIASSYYPCDKKDALEMAIKALEPCEDAISREDAIKRALQCLKGVFVEYEDIARKMFAEDKVPSVQPKIKTGHWIDDEFGSKCSCCGIHTHLDKFDKPMKFKHCSMCGAKMVEPQESEDKG